VSIGNLEPLAKPKLELLALDMLESTVGVGHSGFATPGFGALPVVRVLYRKSTKETEQPLSSTGYKYFDVHGREVRFSNFPQLPGSTLAEKKAADNLPPR
jgi:hypothetical protein